MVVAERTHVARSSVRPMSFVVVGRVLEVVIVRVVKVPSVAWTDSVLTIRAPLFPAMLESAAVVAPARWTRALWLSVRMVSVAWMVDAEPMTA